jgi:DNA-binding CsgD family transcriptional regulator
MADIVAVQTIVLPLADDAVQPAPKRPRIGYVALDVMQAVSSSMPQQARFELTGRQLEIFLLIGRGLDSRRIAAMLGITYYTVRKHRSNILVKLGLNSAAQIACWAAVAAASKRPDLRFAQHGPPWAGASAMSR